MNEKDPLLIMEDVVKEFLNKQKIFTSKILYTNCLLNITDGEELLYIVFYGESDYDKFKQIIDPIVDKSGIWSVGKSCVAMKGLSLSVFINTILTNFDV